MCCGAGHLEPRKASAVPADSLALLWSAVCSTGLTTFSVCASMAVVFICLQSFGYLLPEEVLGMWRPTVLLTGDPSPVTVCGSFLSLRPTPGHRGR